MSDGNEWYPEFYEKMVILVDVSNIRPRASSVRKKFSLNRFSGKKKIEPTSLAYIDSCLAALGHEAPGALIVKFMDRSLLDVLQPDERNTLLFRDDLPFNHEDKVYIISSVEADEPLLAAAQHFNTLVISEDTFSDPKWRKYEIEPWQKVQPHFADESFRFTSSDGVALRTWWNETHGDIPNSWRESEQYETLSYQLRNEINDLTFEWHSGPLTQRIDLPDYVSVSAADETSNIISNSDVELRNKQEVSAQSFEAPFRMVYADDFSLHEELVGRVVILVGRLYEQDGHQFIGWFPSYRLIRVTNHRIASIYGHDRFVSVTGRFEKDLDGFSFTVNPSAKIGSRRFAEIIEQRIQADYELEPTQVWTWVSIHTMFENAARVRSLIFRKFNEATGTTVEPELRITQDEVPPVLLPSRPDTDSNLSKSTATEILSSKPNKVTTPSTSRPKPPSGDLPDGKLWPISPTRAMVSEETTKSSDESAEKAVVSVVHQRKTLRWILLTVTATALSASLLILFL